MKMKTAGQFTAGELKLLAMFSMFCDHAAFVFLQDLSNESLPAAGIYYAMRLFGRMAFPLYAFFLTEGFFRTRNRKQYAVRLGILGLVSEIPYNLMVSGQLFYSGGQNTVLLLFTGLLAMMAMEKVTGKKYEGLLQAGILIAGAAASWGLRLDYGALGFLLIMVFYRWHVRPDFCMMAGCAVIMVIYRDIFAFPAWFAFFFINRYNGEKGWNMGMVPYLFYPAHLLLLAAAGYAGGFL